MLLKRKVDKMKILHICGWHEGGAWTSCKRLNAGLLKMGIGSSIWEKNSSNKDRTKKVSSSILTPIRDFLLYKISQESNFSTKTFGLIGDKNIVNILNDSNADIVHLHSPEYIIPIHKIPKINKKIVWKMADSRAFCGIWQYPNILENDTRYIDGYSRKNYPKTSRGIDIDKWIWLWKKFCWKNLKVTLVAPSCWEAECCQKSYLFSKQRCLTIPNCIDPEIFKPYKQEQVRQEFSLPQDKKIILFGAMSASAKIKGYQYLFPALESIVQHNKSNLYHLAVFGPVYDSSIFNGLNIPMTLTGRINSEEKMAHLYSAADVFVAPSIVESFGNTLMESLACGTPAVSFAVSGMLDIVLHKKNGYLATPYSKEDLADGILYCLKNNVRLKQNTVPYAHGKFADTVVAKQFIQLYKEIIDEKKTTFF